jgi:putative phosphoribosyl transferase
MRFRDRTHAGRELAERLGAYAGRANLLVLGLPRGGVPVALEVARALDAPFDVFIVRKLGVPGHEELAMGAIASGGVRVLNDAVVEELGIDEALIARSAAAESAELERREHAYRGERGPVHVEGRTVILVDDGLATGSTMRAAAFAVRAQRPERIVVAVPVAAAHTCERIRAEVDETVCVHTPDPFQAVGLWYEDFAPVSDDEVRELLEQASEASGVPTTR